MKNPQTWAFAKISHSPIPPQLLARLESIHSHTTLPQQTDSFSITHPMVDSEVRYRWNKPFPRFPYLHQIETNGGGRTIRLHVLSGFPGDVLSLGFEDGKWTRVASTPPEKIKEILSPRRQHTNKRWFRKPATTAQRRKIIEVLGVMEHEVPTLTAFNASIILDTAVIMPHMARIVSLVSFWRSEVDGPNEPLLPFSEVTAS